MNKINIKQINLEKLKTTFKEMNDEKGILGLALLDEIEFQRKTLMKMRKDIDESSLIAEYSGYKRTNPIIAGYNAMMKNYSMLIRQVVELLPENANTEDELDIDSL